MRSRTLSRRTRKRTKEENEGRERGKRGRQKERRKGVRERRPPCVKTPLCVPAKRSHVDHMGAFCRNTGRRVEPTDTLGGFPRVLSRATHTHHTAQHTHNTHHADTTDTKHETHIPHTLSTHTDNNFNTHAHHNLTRMLAYVHRGQPTMILHSKKSELLRCYC